MNVTVDRDRDVSETCIVYRAVERTKQHVWWSECCLCPWEESSNTEAAAVTVAEDHQCQGGDP